MDVFTKRKQALNQALGMADEPLGKKKPKVKRPPPKVKGKFGELANGYAPK